MYVEKYERMRERIDKCSTEMVWLVSPESKQSEILNFCDNRICHKKECIDHRSYNHTRKHGKQIKDIQLTMRNPRAWVFTGWNIKYPERVDEWENIRDFSRRKLSFLRSLLEDRVIGCVSEYTINMELKMWRNHCYLHFHVCMTGLKDIKKVRSLWSRQIKYQKALHRESLADYVSKYATKCQKFYSELHRYYYFIWSYKTYLQRFSIGKVNKKKSGWLHLGTIINEAYKCAKYGYPKKLNKNLQYGGYDNFIRSIEDIGKPPPSLGKVIQCRLEMF